MDDATKRLAELSWTLTANAFDELAGVINHFASEHNNQRITLDKILLDYGKVEEDKE
jgi:hypothetical protein